jgi:hypothetical protein
MAHRTRGADADHEATLATQAGPGAQGQVEDTLLLGRAQAAAGEKVRRVLLFAGREEVVQVAGSWQRRYSGSFTVEVPK